MYDRYRETLSKQYKQEMEESTSAGDNAQCTDRFLSKAAPSTQPYSTVCVLKF